MSLILWTCLTITSPLQLPTQITVKVKMMLSPLVMTPSFSNYSESKNDACFNYTPIMSSCITFTSRRGNGHPFQVHFDEHHCAPNLCNLCSKISFPSPVSIPWPLLLHTMNIGLINRFYSETSKNLLLVLSCGCDGFITSRFCTAYRLDLSFRPLVL